MKGAPLYPGEFKNISYYFQDSESLEDVSQAESARNKAKLEAAKHSMMSTSYEREEQKYVAEEKEKIGSNKSKSPKES